MAALTDATVAIVGLGLVGGSLARALLATGTAVHGWSLDAHDRDAAAATGVAVPEADSGEAALADAVAGAGLVVIAVPLPELAGVATTVVAAARDDALVLHLSGLQRPEATGLEGALAPRVLGTHPLAGSHGSGFLASRADLFAGCNVSAEPRATTAQRAAIERLWHAVGARAVTWRSADDHDAFVAAASHLPQLVATALAATLQAQGLALDDVGPGARDGTRVAASPLPLWEGLLMRGGDDVEIALAAYQGMLSALGRAVSAGDARALAALWERGRAWRTAGEAT